MIAAGAFLSVLALVAIVAVALSLRSVVEDHERTESRLRDPRTHTVTYAIPNGIDWSLDGRTMYFAESVERTVRAYPYDPETGALGRGDVVVRLDDDDGLPDGLTVDAQGCIWLAVWNG